MSPLSENQVRSYADHGYLLVSGLIPDDIIAAAERAMWRLLEKSPQDRSTWLPQPPFAQNFEDAALTSTYTTGVIAVARQLADLGRNREVETPEFAPPRNAHCLIRFPQDDGEEWRWPGPHVDHSIREHGHKTFPRAYRIAAMTYLRDCVPHGANTIVWPDACHRIWDEVETDRERYTDMWTVGERVKELDIGDPVELVPKQGDVLFYDVMCAHAGSMNTADQPRFAMNHKW